MQVAGGAARQDESWKRQAGRLVAKLKKWSRPFQLLGSLVAAPFVWNVLDLANKIYFEVWGKGPTNGVLCYVWWEKINQSWHNWSYRFASLLLCNQFWSNLISSGPVQLIKRLCVGHFDSLGGGYGLCKLQTAMNTSFNAPIKNCDADTNTFPFRCLDWSNSSEHLSHIQNQMAVSINAPIIFLCTL